jgi:hypothetical protein
MKDHQIIGAGVRGNYYNRKGYDPFLLCVDKKEKDLLYFGITNGSFYQGVYRVHGCYGLPFNKDELTTEEQVREYFIKNGVLHFITNDV